MSGATFPIKSSHIRVPAAGRHVSGLARAATLIWRGVRRAAVALVHAVDPVAVVDQRERIHSEYLRHGPDHRLFL